MRVKEVISILETLAPTQLQESYDNSGLVVGDYDQEVVKTLICLDAIEAVVDEAIREGCNLIVAHHPIIFGGLKKLNGKNYVERTVIKAIQNNIAIYAIHTNLDNVLSGGVNSRIAQKLGLSDTKILRQRKGDLAKVVTFVPVEHTETVRAAMCEAGGGHLGNYDQCSFISHGEGSFRGNDLSNAYVGIKNEVHREKEDRLEVIVPNWLLNKVISALKTAHPYEEVAYDVYPLLNQGAAYGSGLMGTLSNPMSKSDFLKHLKHSMAVDTVKYTQSDSEMIQKVAVCGGSGSFLIGDALRSGADAYVTGDVKYHEFFDGENKLMICDIGHYESEQYTIELLGEFLSQKIPNFAVIFTKALTNPVKYYH